MPTLTLGQLAARLRAEVFGDEAVEIDGVAELARAGERQLAPAYRAPQQRARQSRAAALIVGAAPLPLEKSQLVCADPRRALAESLQLFAGEPLAVRPGVHPTAVVATTATIADDARVGPLSVVEARARVGSGCVVEPFSYVGADVVLEDGCRVGPHAVLAAGVHLERGAVVGPGSVVGQPGFGFWRDEQGWHRIPSAGTVRLGAGVELGANCCVDRGTLGATEVGAGSVIDNLVQVGHNVRLGQRTLACAQVGLAGSVEGAEEVILGGQVGVADHVRIGARARVGAGSGVIREVPAGETVSGYPAFEHRRWLRSSALFARLDELNEQLRALRRRLQRLLGGD